MATQQQDKPHKEAEKQQRDHLSVVIGKHVLSALGQPGHLHKIQVRELWEHHYRVNILVGPDASSFKIPHSFFLVADSAGGIIASTPKINRQY